MIFLFFSGSDATIIIAQDIIKQCHVLGIKSKYFLSHYTSLMGQMKNCVNK
jgi:hypothetical protein